MAHGAPVGVRPGRGRDGPEGEEPDILAGTARAVSQAGRIARGLLQSPPADRAAGSCSPPLLPAGGAACHAVAGAEAVVKEILHGPAR